MGVLGLSPVGPRHGVGRLLWVASLVLVAACGPPDIQERLHCDLHGDGSSEVTFTVEFASLSASDSEARQERLAAARTRYFEGWDSWGQRFARAGQASETAVETFAWQRVGGRLARLERTAAFEDPSQLADFFADTDLTVLFSPGPSESEFSVFPGPPTRATEDERERFEALLETWSAAARDYLVEVADLYRYLEGREARAPLIFRAIFEDSSAGLLDSEHERLDRLLETFLAVLEIAEEPDAAGNSLEELARRIYDPFPAHFSVAVDGGVTSRRGFVPLAEGGYEVPPLGLERALSDLEAFWIEPPLLTTYQRLERLGDSSGFDSDAFAARPRRVGELPTAHQIAAAVEAALTPAEQYSLRWRPAPAPDSAESTPDNR